MTDRLVIKVARDPMTAALLLTELIPISQNKAYVSIDTEYSTGPGGKGVDLIQLAVDHSDGTIGSPLKTHRPSTAYVFDLRTIRIIPPQLRELLTAPGIIKIGCGWVSDAARFAQIGLECSPVIDIQHLALTCGFRNTSLNEISDVVCGLNKLSPGDGYNYAAYDAYLTLECYLNIVTYRNPLKTNPPAPVNISTAVEFWRWVQPFLRTRNWSVGWPILLKMVANSYSSWRYLYSREALPDALKDTLHILEGLGYIKSEDDRIVVQPTHQFNLDYDSASSEVESITFEDSPPLLPITKPIFAKVPMPAPAPVPARIISPGVGMSIKPGTDLEPVTRALARTQVYFPPGGLKRESFIRCLMNTNWPEYDPHARRIQAEEVITQAIRFGLLSSSPDGRITQISSS